MTHPNVTRKDYLLNDKLYSMILPPVMLSLPLSSKSIVLVGPLGQLLTDVRNLPSDPTEKISFIITKLGGILKQVDPLLANELMMEAVAMSKMVCDDKPISAPIDFERHFAQYRGEVYQVCIWCLWQCVQDFFPELGGIAQQAKAMAQSFQSPRSGQTTTG